MSRTKYVCVDLDGTIAQYKGWLDETHFGEPIPGAKEALERIRVEGWKIIIFTTRGNRELIKAYLEKHAIPFDHINENPNQPPGTSKGKPVATAYVDDRGIQFNGDWARTTEEILNFVPWEFRNKEQK